MENPSDSVTAKDKITILVAEYNTIRAEIVSRITARFAIVGVLFPLVGAYLASIEKPYAQSFLGAIIFLTALWVYMGWLMERLSRQVRRLEKRINRFAGMRLLSWESRLRSPIFAIIYASGYIGLARLRIASWQAWKRVEKSWKMH